MTASYLRETYLSSAVESHRVGPERFSLWSRRYAGTVVGADDYGWAIDRLAEANAEQSEQRAEVGHAGPARRVKGESELREWVEGTIASAAERLAASAALDVSGLPAIVVRTMDDTTGGQAYYSPGSEDGDHPATIWIGAGGGPHQVEYFKTVVLHESTPGHHIEASYQRRASTLSRFQRLVYIPGHSEGWGLYAERLANEVGLLDTPRERLGFRGSQALRLVSLLIDVGMHTDMEPPTALRPCVGDRWSIEGAIRLVAAQGLDQPTAEYWVTNMAGRPGHRASYVAGERAWLDARAESSRRGETLHAFHSRMLGMGPLGLDEMRLRSTRGTKDN